MTDAPSDTPAPSGPTASPVRRVPGWVSVVVILACLGGVGWMGWAFWGRPASGSRVEVLPRDPADRVTRNIRNNNEWTIVGGLGEVTLTRKADGQPPALAFAFRDSQQLLTPEQAKALKGAQLVLERNSTVEPLGVKDEQMRALEARWATRFDIQKLDPSDEQEIRKLFETYEPLERAVDQARVAAVDAKDAPDAGRRQAADQDRTRQEAAKQAAEDRLCDAAEAVARRKVPPYRKDAAERAALVKSVLTEGQQKQLEQINLPGVGGRRGRGR